MDILVDVAAGKDFPAKLMLILIKMRLGEWGTGEGEKISRVFVILCFT